MIWTPESEFPPNDLDRPESEFPPDDLDRLELEFPPNDLDHTESEFQIFGHCIFFWYGFSHVFQMMISWDQKTNDTMHMLMNDYMKLFNECNT